MLFEQDESQLANMYPNGIPDGVLKTVERVQARRHSSNIGTGPSLPETLLLATIIGEQQQRIAELEHIVNCLLDEVDPRDVGLPKSKPELKPESKPESQSEEIREPQKPASQKTNWFQIKGGTPVICETENGPVDGIFKIAMKGADKGMLRVQVKGSPNEVDVFKKNQVKLA